MHSKSGLTSRTKIFICRLILIVSLFWVLVDVLLIFTLTDRLHNKTDSSERKKGFPLVNVNFREHISDILRLAGKTNGSIENQSIVSTVKESFDENPTDWPGEQGRPVTLPEQLKKISAERFKENSFDVIISDMIALNRSVGEQRNKKCLQKFYDDDLPNTSVIIIYHNEANSTLLRGLTSIIRKTPLKYLKEIILVDDASLGREYLHEPLDKFVKTLPVDVKIFRNEIRQGLIRSRLIGAAAATGDTLTFLDAHIEATNGWLEPLLFEIKKNK